jgi:poly(A) polymerase
MDDNRASFEPSPAPRILGPSDHPIQRAMIDPDALKIISRLHSQGFIAYLTGGGVRDLMLGKRPKDFDIVTNARPGQIKKRFPNAYVIGRRFRLVHIHVSGGRIIEVSTFRRALDQDEEEIAAADGHRMRIYGTPFEDAFRRDITINGLFYDPVMDAVVDYVGGVEDLAARKVRVIGDPAERFREDPVRIWRVIRYAARLEFRVDERTEREIPSHLGLLDACSGARLFEELNKDLAYETRPVIEGLRNYHVLGHILGRIGGHYETDEAVFSRLSAILDRADKAKAAGFPITVEEMYALAFWPWAEPLLADSKEDPHKTLANALLDAQCRITLPRSIRANVIQMFIIVAALVRALRTGRMRWSLLRRAHFDQASRLFYLIEKCRFPEAGESFETLYHQTHPSGDKTRGRFPLRRRRKPKSQPESQS